MGTFVLDVAEGITDCVSLVMLIMAQVVRSSSISSIASGRIIGDTLQAVAQQSG
jgi:hypothetical protein